MFIFKLSFEKFLEKWGKFLGKFSWQKISYPLIICGWVNIMFGTFEGSDKHINPKPNKLSIKYI